MNKYEVVQKIEKFAPLETQEKWDCSGWLVERNGKNIDKILFCLTVTPNVVVQAKKQNCDMIISHHPLFYVPFEYKDINIYCAHTNFDKAEGGTTDTLVKKLGFTKTQTFEFVRIVDLKEEITIEELKQKLLKISPKMRYINNSNISKIKSIAFCAGSGSEFIDTTATQAFITGDLKFHAALDAKQAVFDIGHFESEIFAPEILKKITNVKEKGVIACEKSPFI